MPFRSEWRLSPRAKRAILYILLILSGRAKRASTGQLKSCTCRARLLLPATACFFDRINRIYWMVRPLAARKGSFRLSRLKSKHVVFDQNSVPRAKRAILFILLIPSKMAERVSRSLLESCQSCPHAPGGVAPKCISAQYRFYTFFTFPRQLRSWCSAKVVSMEKESIGLPME